VREGGLLTTSNNNNSNSSVVLQDDDGIIPRACVDLFQNVRDKCDGNAKVELSYLEIYKEEIRDLLAIASPTTTHQELKIRETLEGDVYVSGLTEQEVRSTEHVGQFMEEASRRRVVASTAMNAVSSRSHAICTLRISGVVEGTKLGVMDKFTAKLTLVDLAGSERIKKTNAQGNQRQEGIR
jgi:kinesin family protein 4/21/27